MPFIVDDLAIAALLGTGIGAAGGAAQGFAGKKKAEQKNLNAGIQSAWSGISRKMAPGQTVDVPDPGAEMITGGIKGGITGVGMYGDLAKSFKPEQSINIGTNTVGAPSAPGLTGSSPSLAPSQGSMNEINNNIWGGLNASPGTTSVQSARKSFGYGSRMPASTINTVPQMRPWNQYGGTGGR
jgi:hypothetical protein